MNYRKFAASYVFDLEISGELSYIGVLDSSN